MGLRGNIRHRSNVGGEDWLRRLVLSRTGARRECEFQYLKRYCKIEEISNEPKVLRFIPEQEYSMSESALMFRLSTIVSTDYFVTAEFALGHLAHAINIPLQQIEQQGLTLPRDATTVFVCRSGVRSLKACALARRAGLIAPLQLEGGLLAWKAAVEPSLPL